MTIQTVLILFSIGISAGLLSGFVGVGGGYHYCSSPRLFSRPIPT